MKELDINKELDCWIEENRNWMVEELKSWVSHPSVSRADLAAPGAPYGPDCKKMLDFALQRGKELGFRTRNNEGYCGDIFYGDSEEEIGFVSHLDVVPEGEHWIYEPYNPIEKDGFVIGRGVGDNKGSAILVLSALRFFKEKQIPLRKTLRLMLGLAEETGMADYKYYLEELHGKVPAVSIVADAAFPVCYAQKGGYNATLLVPAGKDVLEFSAGSVRNNIPDEAKIVFQGIAVDEVKKALSNNPKLDISELEGKVQIISHGKAGHAAFPEAADNAIKLLAVALKESGITEKADLAGVDFIADAFASPFGEGLGIAFSDEESGKLTLNAGVIRKEKDSFRIEIDIRYPVTFEASEITDILTERLKKENVVLTNLETANPYYINPKDKKVLALMQIYKELTGDDAQPYAMGGGTYSRVIPNGISYGPGLRTKRVLPEFLPEGHGGGHGPDEVLNIESWLLSFRIYVNSILKLDELDF